MIIINNRIDTTSKHQNIIITNIFWFSNNSNQQKNHTNNKNNKIKPLHIKITMSKIKQSQKAQINKFPKVTLNKTNNKWKPTTAIHQLFAS